MIPSRGDLSFVHTRCFAMIGGGKWRLKVMIAGMYVRAVPLKISWTILDRFVVDE